MNYYYNFVLQQFLCPAFIVICHFLYSFPFNMLNALAELLKGFMKT